MARYSDILVDQNSLPIPGAQVYVNAQNGALATLTADDATSLKNPITTQSDGSYYFNTGDGLYDLAFWYCGREVERKLGVPVGTPAIVDATLRGDLAASNGVSLVGGAASTADLATFETNTNLTLLDKVSNLPQHPYSPLQSGYSTALNEFDAAWWDITNSHIKHTSGGGFNFGLYDSTLTTVYSMWQSAAAVRVYYEAWKYAGTTGDTATLTFTASRLNAQWSHIVATYSATDLRTGGNGIVNTLDDGAWYLSQLCMFADFFGWTGAGAVAAGYCVEALAFLLNRFKNTRETQTDYGVSTPLGTAFKSNPHGALYTVSTITTYGYVSMSLEAQMASCAMDLWANYTALGPTLKAALQFYAQNTWTWINTTLRTPAPGNSLQPAQGLYATYLNLDVNVDANHNGTINGGAAAKGSYDINQAYLQPVYTYFVPGEGFQRAPIRGQTHLYDTGTQAMAILSAKLYNANNGAGYLAEANNIIAVYTDPKGFGRTKDGLPYICNVRDPLSAGFLLPELMRTCQNLTGFDLTYGFGKAAMNSAKKVLLTRLRGNMDANWSGPELNPIDGSYTWEDTSGAQGGGGGGQAKREQIMVSAGSLNLVISAMYNLSNEISFGSGTVSAMPYNQLLLEFSALRQAVAESMSRSGGNFTGGATFRDNYNGIDINPAGSPQWTMDNVGGGYIFVRGSALHQRYVTNVKIEELSSTGVTYNGNVAASSGINKGYVQLQPGTSIASGYTVYATPDGNQQGYIGGTGNGTHLPITASTAAGGIDLFVGTTKVLSINASGNLKTFGTITPAVTP